MDNGIDQTSNKNKTHIFDIFLNHPVGFAISESGSSSYYLEIFRLPILRKVESPFGKLMSNIFIGNRLNNHLLSVLNLGNNRLSRSAKNCGNNFAAGIFLRKIFSQEFV